MNLTDTIGMPPEVGSFKEDDAFVLPMCRVGLELEIERCYHPQDIDQKFWNIKQDGSLRDNGREFVLRRPLFGQDLRESIETLCGFIAEKRETRPDSYKDNSRTSLHVHIDARDMGDTSSVFKLFMLYCIFEKALFRFAGPSRESNNFCIPMYRSPLAVRSFCSLLTDDMTVYATHNRFYKYNAFNAEALTQFGSIEFRHANARVDQEFYFDWINMLMCLKRVAMEEGGVSKNLDQCMSEDGPEAFLERVFGERLANKLTYPDLVRDMYDGLRLAYIGKNWHEQNQKQRRLSRAIQMRTLNDPDSVHPFYR